MEQIERRREERALLGEQQEQEKEQLLVQMDQLLAEDLRVSAVGVGHWGPWDQGERCCWELLSAKPHTHTDSH